MGDKFTVLITDRNRHVREFLQREFAAEGYRVETAQDGRDALAAIEGNSPPDLLVLDPDIPYAEGPAMLERLSGRTPLLPVVIHCFSTESTGCLTPGEGNVVVEKSGSTAPLKTAVAEMLKKFYPQHSSNDESPGWKDAHGKKAPDPQ